MPIHFMELLVVSQQILGDITLSTDFAAYFNLVADLELVVANCN